MSSIIRCCCARRSRIPRPSRVSRSLPAMSALSFLGDSILGAVVARSLFESYPEFDEGKLTRLKVSLVSGATLSEVSHELGIDDIIIFGASETGTGARGLHSALENVYESLVGALYLDAVGMRRRSSFTVRSSRTWPPSVPSTPRTPSRSCRSACRQTATSLPRISWSAPRAPRMRPPLPLWCSSTVFVKAAALVPPRRRPREPLRSRRSTAWATPPTA